jgi:uncharacterized membrane protein
MPPVAIEWLHALIRWTHVIAAIMWIGDSFLFVWMDRSLQPPTRAREGDVAGELWMVHSGGFYEVIKRRTLAPGEVPQALHWFKWEAYTTWLSGFALLVVVYWLGARAYLTGGLAPAAAIAASLGALVVAVALYEGVWNSPLGRRGTVAVAVSGALFVALAWGLTRLFNGRAAFLLAGASLGTIMAANVAHVIIPAQRRMLAAARTGAPMDPRHGQRAKVRSLHNHYLTLPVLFMMLSSHFPATWGHPFNWIILTLIVVAGMAIKHVMNARGGSDRRIVAAGALALVAAVGMTAHPPPGPAAAGTVQTRVPFGVARAIVERRCLSCHAAHPTNPSFAAPPLGVMLDDPARMHALAPRMLERAVVTRTMPLGNLTGMTDEERRTLGAWIAQGARIDGVPPRGNRRP